MKRTSAQVLRTMANQAGLKVKDVRTINRNVAQGMIEKSALVLRRTRDGCVLYVGVGELPSKVQTAIDSSNRS